MENVNIVLAANILKYRKKSGLSQDELAQKLGVTFQAVSKWENAKAAPDITFLPIMADIFGCYIDELFSREIKTEIHYDHCSEFPWADDNTIRIFQRELLKTTAYKLSTAFGQHFSGFIKSCGSVHVFIV